jgi:Domain of unknown function (DUF1707)
MHDITIYLPRNGNELVADAKREELLSFLNTAYVRGYLTAGQHSARVAEALTARKSHELARLIKDLPDAIPATNSEPCVWPLPFRLAKYALAGFTSAWLTLWATGTVHTLLKGAAGGFVSLIAITGMCAIITSAGYVFSAIDNRG